ncbi:hypothetical protein F4678DRAFT_466710 [Xylaria arbuscula]|nr:hypothetical protein F4678DRAFT_466710 [Xylaria arbuscula]
MSRLHERRRPDNSVNKRNLGKYSAFATSNAWQVLRIRNLERELDVMLIVALIIMFVNGVFPTAVGLLEACSVTLNKVMFFTLASFLPSSVLGDVDESGTRLGGLAQLFDESDLPFFTEVSISMANSASLMRKSVNGSA